MIKGFRFLAICMISVAFATLSIASAQQYTTIDFPGSVGTSLNGGPNPQGTNIGSYVDTGGALHGFVLYKGTYTTIDPPGSIFTVPTWITPEGVIVGEYLDSSDVSHGFILAGGSYTTVDFPGAAGTLLSTLNPSGQLSGAWCVVASCLTSLTGVTHSFVMSKKGVFSSFDPPGAISSIAVTVTATGTIFGSYTDSSGVGHGYELYHGTFTPIDFPGSVFTLTGAANPEGDSVGLYVDSSGFQHSFLLRKGVFTSFDPPDAVPLPLPIGLISEAAGINPSGVIAGFFFDASEVEHGYIRTP